MSDGKLWVPKKRIDLDTRTVLVINKVLDRIPQLPVSVKKIIEMASDMDIGAKELAEVALTDPVLSSKILTMVNSSYYGLNRRIDDLRVAIVLIGFNAVRNIAIQNRFLELLDDSENDFYSRENLWIHSYLVSVCAESFVRDDNSKYKGILMTLGILHDIGKFTLFAIARLLQEKGKKLSSSTLSPSKHTLQREEKYIGVNHPIIGSMLAAKWNLPDRIRAVIEYHHFPSFYGIREIPDQYLEEISSICIADIVVNRYLNDTNNLPMPHKLYFDFIGQKHRVEEILTDELKQKLNRAEEFVQNLV